MWQFQMFLNKRSEELARLYPPPSVHGSSGERRLPHRRRRARSTAWAPFPSTCHMPKALHAATLTPPFAGKAVSLSLPQPCPALLRRWDFTRAGAGVLEGVGPCWDTAQGRSHHARHGHVCAAVEAGPWSPPGPPGPGVLQRRAQSGLPQERSGPAGTSCLTARREGGRAA